MDLPVKGLPKWICQSMVCQNGFASQMFVKMDLPVKGLPKWICQSNFCQNGSAIEGLAKIDLSVKGLPFASQGFERRKEK